MEPQPTPEELAQELQRRARRDAFLRAGPLGMAVALEPREFRSAPHLALLNRWLIEAAQGIRRRLVISMPPRHGKSETVSRWFVAWFLALWPRKRVILCSYEADFAASWGRKVRNTLTEHAESVPVRVSDDSSAANRWHTTKGGGMETAGVGGPITGKGADLLIIDDPVKNAEEADSQTVRDAHWAWWTTTARTRLEPGSSAVVIMTRWHEDDLVGRLLSQQAKREPGSASTAWDVLELPALAGDKDTLGRAPGAALWPDRYSEKDLAEIRADVEARAWNALYQQRPTPDEGALFMRQWFRYWRLPSEPEPTDSKLKERTGVLPKHFNEVLQSWDLAFKETAGSDLVAGAKVGCNGARRFLLDLCWRRLSFTESLTEMVSLAKASPAGGTTLVEDAANGPAAVSSLRQSLPGIVAIRAQGSKRARAAAVTPIVRAGQFYLPLYAPWRQELEEHLVAFPFAQHDDAADAITQALNYAKHRDYEPIPDEAAPAGTQDWRAADIERMQRQLREETEEW